MPVRPSAAWSGKLLVATPLISDGIFAHCVLLLMHHGNTGTLGAVLDAPLNVSPTLCPEPFSKVITQPAVAFMGGPVDPASVTALIRHSNETKVDIGSPLPRFSHSRMIDPEDLPEFDPDELDRLRFFQGCASWAPGQLEQEVREGAWILVDAEPEDPWCADPAGLRDRVLKRQKTPLNWLRFAPINPIVN